MYQYNRYPEPLDKLTSRAAAQWKNPKLSNMTAMTMVAIMVIEAPLIFPKISTMSDLDTIPVSRIMAAPMAAGHASLMPFGLQKMTSIVIVNTKMAIPISIFISMLLSSKICNEYTLACPLHSIYIHLLLEGLCIRPFLLICLFILPRHVSSRERSL